MFGEGGGVKCEKPPRGGNGGHRARWWMNKRSRTVHVEFTSIVHDPGMRKLLLILTGLGIAACSHAAEAELLVVDRDLSRIDIDVQATIGSFTGNLADYDAEIRYHPDSSEVRSAQIRFRFADVTTGEEKRDHHMHVWQETETFPHGRFVLGQLKPPDANGQVMAVGELTLHGQTRKIEFPVSILMENRTVVIDGEAVIDTQNYGLPIIRKFLALKVNPLVTIRFHLHTTHGESA